MRLIDLTGQTFGRLTVIERVGTYVSPGGQKKPTWSCTCQCGIAAVVTGNNLRSGQVQSCGCLLREATIATRRAERMVVPTYGAAHHWVRQARGSASEHQCVDCGDPAREWAYDHTDPDEMSEKQGRLTLSYSAKPQHYQPMCKPCHRRFDAGRSA